MGKIAKRFLCTGTVTHTNPVKSGRGERWGGIFTIIGPRCWTTHSAFQDDNVGLGILTQFSMVPKCGPIILLATYWPIRQSPVDVISNKRKIWTKIAQLIKNSNLLDRTHMAYLQRISLHLILTEDIHASKGTILCGDFNARCTAGYICGSIYSDLGPSLTTWSTARDELPTAFDSG